MNAWHFESILLRVEERFRTSESLIAQGYELPIWKLIGAIVAIGLFIV
jgi:hypothetical protein